MKKEQIVKALECCKGESISCSECVYADFGQCQMYMADDALSLIREQDKRIEELTLEYAGFEAGAKDAANFIKYATVRKLAERLKDRYEFNCNADEDNALYFVDLCEWVERIAKEIMEENK